VWLVSCRHSLAWSTREESRSPWLSHRTRRSRSTPVYHCLSTPRRSKYRYIFGRDSDLEAFSHNPSDGSLAPLAYQPST